MMYERYCALRDALWGLLELEKDMKDEKLRALQQVIEALDATAS